MGSEMCIRDSGETIHLKLLGHNKDRQLRIRGFSAGLEGRAAWMMNSELELIVPRRAVFERHCSATLNGERSTHRYLSSETIEW